MKNVIILYLILMTSLTIPSISFGSKDLYGIILAGGSGKRLWPLSREKKPKQFIKLNKKTLLESTIERISPLTKNGSLCIVTTNNHIEYTKKYLSKIDNLIIEPASRNTAPALLMATLDIYNKNPNAIIFFVPADHYIPDSESYRSSLLNAINYTSNNDNIALIGVEPSYAATGYGYIERGKQLNTSVFQVNKFHEKPNTITAEKYLNSPEMLWNTGVFCAKASVFLNEFKKHAPNLVESMNKYINNEISYSEIQEDAFDTAVLEKSNKCVVVPSSFEWSDVGNLEQYIIAQHTKSNDHKTIEYHANNNISYTDKLIVFIDTNDLCVIDTKDVLLISNKKSTDSVKNVIGILNNQKLNQYT